MTSRIHFAVAFALVSSILACGGDSSTGPSTPTRTPVAVTLSVATAQPLQVANVGFPSAAGTTGASLSAKLGSNTIQIVLSDSVTGSFFIPDVAAGRYTLTVDFGSSSQGTASLNVTAAPAIADPKSEVTTALAPVTQAVDSLVSSLQATPLDSSNLTADQVAYLKDQNSALKAALASATTADLRAFALWLRANPDVIGSATALLAPARSPSTALSANDMSASVDAYISEYNQRVIAAGLTIGACVAGIPVSGLVTGPGSALIAAACGALIGWQATGIADMVTTKLWSLYVIVDQLNIDLSNPSDSKAAVSADFFAASSPFASVAVEPGVTTHLSTTARLRTIGSGDRSKVGDLFTALDRVTALFTPLFNAVPKLRSFNFGPTGYVRYETAEVAGTDISVSAPGCTAAPDADGINLTCSQVDANNDVSVNATFTYNNRYGSSSVTVPVTVRRTWATVGTPTVTLLTYVYPWSTLGNGNLLVSCYFDMTFPVQGNTPITFTRWDGIWVGGWANNYTEGGDVNFTVDPRQYTSVKWWDRQLVTGMLPGTHAPQFYVDYTIYYSVPATGQTGSLETRANCQ